MESHMPAELTIRPATPDDCEIVVDYNHRLAAETEDKHLCRETLRRGVAALLDDASKGRYFLACRQGRVVGQTMVTFEWSDWRNGPIWWIQSVYVEPEARREGVFRALYEHIRQTAQREGVVGLRLYVEQNNARAQSTYQSMGMHNAGYLVFETMFKPGP
jgi:GNAT superfamily N-acetyltransferase